MASILSGEFYIIFRIEICVLPCQSGPWVWVWTLRSLLEKSNAQKNSFKNQSKLGIFNRVFFKTDSLGATEDEVLSWLQACCILAKTILSRKKKHIEGFVLSQQPKFFSSRCHPSFREALHALESDSTFHWRNKDTGSPFFVFVHLLTWMFF